jgi:hypothetical protein
VVLVKGEEMNPQIVRATLAAAVLTMGAFGTGVAHPSTATASTVSTTSTGSTTWYTKAEAIAYATPTKALEVLKYSCNGAAFLGTTAVANCKTEISNYSTSAYNTFNDAKTYGQCVKMKMLWTGQVTSLSRYACT